MRITKRGLITIPPELRLKYDIKPGDEVDFVDTPQGIRIVPRGRDAHSAVARSD